MSQQTGWNQNIAPRDHSRISSPPKQRFAGGHGEALLLESNILQFSGNSISKENIIRRSEEIFGRWTCVSAHLHWRCLFHLLYQELISEQLGVDDVFIRIKLSAPSMLVAGYEDCEFLL